MKPTHTLTVKKKDSSAPASKVGVAWMNDKGWLTIQLDPCVVTCMDQLSEYSYTKNGVTWSFNNNEAFAWNVFCCLGFNGDLYINNSPHAGHIKRI